MIGLYDVSTQLNSNNLSTKTPIRSQASTEEIDSWLDQNIIGNKPVRQQRISSVSQSYSQSQSNQTQQGQQQNGTTFKRVSNITNMDYYSNAKVTTQSTKNSKNSSFSFIFDENGGFNSTKAETSRQMLFTENKHKEPKNEQNNNISDPRLINSKYDNEFLEVNYTQIQRNKINAKEYSFPIILSKDKQDEGQQNSTFKSKQFYDQTSSQPLHQGNPQKDDVPYQSQPKIQQHFEKPHQQTKQRINYSSYQKKRVDLAEANNANNHSPLRENPLLKSTAMEPPNKNNRIRSQIYQKKRQQFENIFINDQQLSNSQQNEGVSNINNGFGISDREAFIEGDQIQSNSSSPKNVQTKSNMIQQVLIKPSKIQKADTSTSTNYQAKRNNITSTTNTYNTNNNTKQDIITSTTSNSSNKNTYNVNQNMNNQTNNNKDNSQYNINVNPNNRYQEDQIKKKDSIILSIQQTLDNVKYTSDNLQFEQECFEEMHFFQVEFLQKCKQWMNKLEKQF